MFEAVLYFAGPKTIWSGKVDNSEVIMRREIPWHWLARTYARSAYAKLDKTRCGYIVLKNGEPVEHVEPDLK